MNRVMHFEIPSDDPQKSMQFFRDVFGWEFEQFGGDEYWLTKTGDKSSPGIDGAIMKKRHEDQPVVNTIAVKDINETLPKIEKAGGVIVVPKFAVENIGWVAYFKDLDGNIHGIIEPDMSVKAQGLVIERIFDATAMKTWKAWTDSEMTKKWWGPKGFTAPSISIDLNVGGKYLFCMRSPDGKDYWSTGKYLEIIPGKKLVMTDSFSDEKGNVVSAEKYGMKDFPLELRVEVTFEDQPNGKAKMTLRHIGMPPGEMSDGALVGWNESFDKLSEVLK